MKTQRGINALDSTGELLLALVSAGRALPLRDLAAAAGMPAAKAFPHLVSLQKIGLLSRDDAGCFGGGPLGQALGLIAMQRVSPTRDAEAEIVALAGATDMSVAAATLAARPHGNPPGGIGTTAAREPAGRHGDVARQYGDRTNLRGRHVRRRAGRPARQRRAPAGRAAAPVDAAFRARLATIRADELDFAFDAPVPGIGTVAAPVFDHTGSIRLVIAIIGSSRGFPRGPDSDLAQALLAATRRLSWRFGGSADSRPFSLLPRQTAPRGAASSRPRTAFPGRDGRTK